MLPLERVPGSAKFILVNIDTDGFEHLEDIEVNMATLCSHACTVYGLTNQRDIQRCIKETMYYCEFMAVDDETVFTYRPGSVMTRVALRIRRVR